MWDRDKNFYVLMLYELSNCENKISLIIFFAHPLFVFGFGHFVCDIQREQSSRSFWYVNGKYTTKFSSFVDG